jgi:hypothetical protein
MSDIEAKRAARRAAMPTTTEFIEQYADFAPTLIYASENGKTYGKEPVDENAFTIPRGYGMTAPIPARSGRGAQKVGG